VSTEGTTHRLDTKHGMTMSCVVSLPILRKFNEKKKQERYCH